MVYYLFLQSLLNIQHCLHPAGYLLQLIIRDKCNYLKTNLIHTYIFEDITIVTVLENRIQPRFFKTNSQRESPQKLMAAWLHAVTSSKQASTAKAVQVQLWAVGMSIHITKTLVFLASYSCLTKKRK